MQWSIWRAELHVTRHGALVRASHATAASSASRWRRRAERHAHRAERAGARAERAADRARLALGHGAAPGARWLTPPAEEPEVSAG